MKSFNQAIFGNSRKPSQRYIRCALILQVGKDKSMAVDHFVHSNRGSQTAPPLGAEPRAVLHDGQQSGTEVRADVSVAGEGLESLVRLRGTDSAQPSRKAVPTLSVVVPMHDEEAVVRLTHRALIGALGTSPFFALEVVYVDDGSRDRTGEILLTLAADEPRAKVVCLSRNFGHQQAISAGLVHASGDVVAVMDGDLQDPPEVVVLMLDRWRAGYDVVYGVRAGRKESLLHRTAYAAFYRLFKFIASIDMPLDSGDFALMDRSVVDVLNALPEKTRFVRGLRAWAGFRHSGLVYERQARAAGETKYPIWKLFKLALDGIVGFSRVPLRIVLGLGLISSIGAIAAFALLLTQRAFGFDIWGWDHQDISEYFLVAILLLLSGGVQLAAIGVLGEYIGRIHQEATNRPGFVVRMVFQANRDRAQTRSRS